MRNAPDVPKPAAATNNPISKLSHVSSTVLSPTDVARSATTTRVSMFVERAISAATPVSKARRRPTSTTLRLDLPSRKAVARPMPDEAPVITAHGPYRLKRRVDLASSCALPTLSLETARAGDDTRIAYDDEFQAIAKALQGGLDGKQREDRRLAIRALSSGGLSVAHAVHDRRLGARIACTVRRLRATRRVIAGPREGGLAPNGRRTGERSVKRLAYVKDLPI